MNSPASLRFHALVPCAGQGARAGFTQPKQYAHVAGVPMVQHTLCALARVERLHTVLVVLHPQDQAFATQVPDFKGQVSHAGGASRAHTVLGGLNALRALGAESQDWVLVHDAARCLLQPAWVDALIDACQHDEVGGLLALPVADTLKRATNSRVNRSVGRAGMWQAQTPQMFRLQALHTALSKALETEGSEQAALITDEASAIEAMGQAPLLVAGALENFKLTFPSDFELAERILRTRPP